MSNLVKVKFVTGLVKFANVHLYKPYSYIDGALPKYSLTLIFPKPEKSEILRLQRAFSEVVAANKDFLSVRPLKKSTTNPKNGDESAEKIFSNSVYITATSFDKPGIVDVDLHPILDSAMLYDGCFGRASVTLYPYQTETLSGIAIGLNNVQKLKDGEKFPVSKNVADFDDI